MPPAVTQGSRDKQVRFQAPRPVQPAVAASSYAPQGAYLGITGVADAIRDRKWKNAEAASYADGGMVKFSGKGGPRGDKIPVKVAGAEIRVSNGENAVILPAKTAANPAAVQAINGIIQATNDGRKPQQGISAGAGYANGLTPFERERSMSMYRGELAMRDAMAARATEQANMQAAIDRAQSQPAINPKSVPAQPIYRPNWTPGNSAPVLEGTVETTADRAAKALSSAPRAIPAPQPGTAVVPRTINWTPGGNPPAGGPMQSRSVDWTYGEGGGPRQGISAAVRPQVATLALPGPEPQLSGADPRTSSRTANAARAANGLSPEAQAWNARSNIEGKLPSAAAPPGLARAATINKYAGRVLAPVGAAIAAGNIVDVATDPEKTGSDVAAQIAREAGGWGSAGVGAALGAKGGAALGAIGGPLAPITVPAGAALGGIAGGIAGYYGANKLMDLGGKDPSKTSQGIVTGMMGGSASRPAVQQEKLSNESTSSPIQQPNQINTAIAAPTGNSGATQRNGLTVTQMGAGFDPTRLTMAPGYGMASNAAGKTVSVGPSQYVAADGSPTSRWEDTAAYQDAISRNERNKIRLAEMQANRSGQNPIATLAASRSIADAAMNAPFDQQTRQAQAQSAAMDLAQKKRVDALAETYRNAKTPEEQAKALDEFNALTGRSKEEWKAVHAAGRQTIDGKEPDQVILYNSKGETRVLGAGAPAQSPQTQAAEAIKSQWLAGKISREQAVNELKKLGTFQ
jgi:hypothetical protein